MPKRHVSHAASESVQSSHRHRDCMHWISRISRSLGPRAWKPKRCAIWERKQSGILRAWLWYGYGIVMVLVWHSMHFMQCQICQISCTLTSQLKRLCAPACKGVSPSLVPAWKNSPSESIWKAEWCWVMLGPFGYAANFGLCIRSHLQ